jgi:hypothetical protein
MCAIFKIDWLLFYEGKIGFMHKSSGLQGVVRTLSA